MIRLQTESKPPPQPFIGLVYRGLCLFGGENPQTPNKHLTDCPACAKSISPSIVDLKQWTSLVTNQQLALLDLKPTFLCRCGNEFQTGFEIILNQKHHGCAECYKKTSQEKRYFHFNKLREIVSKRGFILSPPLPKTYNCNLHVKRTGENHEYPYTLHFPARKMDLIPSLKLKNLLMAALQ